jgi:hypothetical protein
MLIELIMLKICKVNVLMWLLLTSIVYFLSKKEPAECTFVSNSKIVDAGI